MRRILILAAVLWFYSATFAFAGNVVTYNPGGHSGDPIRTIQVYYVGWCITVVITETLPGGCVRTTTTEYAFFKPTGTTVETVCQ